MMSSEGAPRASEMLVSSGTRSHDTGSWREGAGAAAGGRGRILTGVRCGAYEIAAPISSGAMGAVYRARHLDSGKEVALKRLLEEAGTRRFEIEARLLAT